MATRVTTQSASTVMEASNGERERVFEAFRQWGYLEADLDPLGFLRPVAHPDLQVHGAFVHEARRVYCGTIGAVFMDLTDPDHLRWIQERIEVPQPAVDQEAALDQLIRAKLFEQVLQQRYLGTKRFSLEGVTALIPLVDEILEGAGRRGAVELVMGMSHRGRLNVIVQIARRPPEEVFAGFEDVDPRSVLGGGDVKYHMGATGEYVTRAGARIHIHLVSNPSHLEAVDPVTVGRTRAKQERAGEGGAQKYLPLLVHGDGAFAGQGILAETLTYSALPGYTVCGTIHIIANNLIVFPTTPRETNNVVGIGRVRGHGVTVEVCVSTRHLDRPR
jgi:2-oxoglutarate dehydrogenase E1 component